MENLNRNAVDCESVLRELLLLQTHCGVVLPMQGSSSEGQRTDPSLQSLMSLNSVTDDEKDTEHSSLWRRIRTLLVRGLSRQLEELPVVVMTRGELSSMNLVTSQRYRYLQGLSMLLTSDQLWRKYRGVRERQLESNAAGKTPNDGKPSKITKSKSSGIQSLVQELERIILQARNMMYEDFYICLSGVFSQAITPYKAMSELYLSHLLEHLHIFAEKLQNNFESSTADGKAPRMGKSSTIAAFLASSSHTGLDFTKSMNQFGTFSDIRSVPTDNLGFVVHITGLLRLLDQDLDHLRDISTWKNIPGQEKATLPERPRSKSLGDS